MGDHYCYPPVKKVEHPVVNSLVAGPEFVDFIAEIISLRSSKLMPNFLKSAESRQAFLNSLSRDLVKPLGHWDDVFILLVVNNIDGQTTSSMFSLLRTAVNVPMMPKKVQKGRRFRGEM